MWGGAGRRFSRVGRGEAERGGRTFFACRALRGGADIFRVWGGADVIRVWGGVDVFRVWGGVGRTFFASEAGRADVFRVWDGVGRGGAGGRFSRVGRGGPGGRFSRMGCGGRYSRVGRAVVFRV